MFPQQHSYVDKVKDWNVIKILFRWWERTNTFFFPLCFVIPWLGDRYSSSFWHNRRKRHSHTFSSLIFSHSHRQRHERQVRACPCFDAYFQDSWRFGIASSHEKLWKLWKLFDTFLFRGEAVPKLSKHPHPHIGNGTKGRYARVHRRFSQLEDS